MREMIRIASEIQKSAYDDTKDVFELLDTTQLSMINLMAGISSQQAISIKDSTIEVFKEISTNTAVS